MRVERSGAFLAVLGVCGCAIDLDSHEAPSAARPAGVPELVGCLPLHRSALAVEGRIGAADVGAAAPLLMVSSARLSGEEDVPLPSSRAFLAGEADCFADGEALEGNTIDTAAWVTELRARPLAAISVDTPRLFFAAEDPSGLRGEGFGIARWDAARNQFVARALLWTSDRPSYGSGAVVHEGRVYVFGGLAARFLTADVYLARVAVADVEEAAAYEYWRGGGNWSPDADDARPLLEGGASPSVMWHAERARWLMLYTTPIAAELSVRSGLSPWGPWSGATALGRCELPASDQGAFCADASWLPELAREGELVVSQGVAAFSRPPSAAPEDYWTRLHRGVRWPEALP